MSFFGSLGLNRACDPERAKGTNLPVASLLDLAATKLVTIVQRASLKDYLDIAALLKARIGLPEALGAARAVYGAQFNPLLSLKALSYFEEGDVKRLDPEKQRRLIEAVRAVDIEKIPAVNAREGLL